MWAMRLVSGDLLPLEAALAAVAPLEQAAQGTVVQPLAHGLRVLGVHHEDAELKHGTGGDGLGCGQRHALAGGGAGAKRALAATALGTLGELERDSALLHEHGAVDDLLEGRQLARTGTGHAAQGRAGVLEEALDLVVPAEGHAVLRAGEAGGRVLHGIHALDDPDLLFADLRLGGLRGNPVAVNLGVAGGHAQSLLKQGQAHVDSLADALKAVPALLHDTYHPSMVLGTAPPVPLAIYNHSKLQNNIDGNIETHNSIMTWETLPPPLMAELLTQEPHAPRQCVGEDLLGKEVVEAVAYIRHPPHAVGLDGQEALADGHGHIQGRVRADGGPAPLLPVRHPDLQAVNGVHAIHGDRLLPNLLGDYTGDAQKLASAVIHLPSVGLHDDRKLGVQDRKLVIAIRQCSVRVRALDSEDAAQAVHGAAGQVGPQLPRRLQRVDDIGVDEDATGFGGCGLHERDVEGGDVMPREHRVFPDEVEERVKRIADGGSALEHIVGDAVDAPRSLGHRPLNRHERREQALRQAVLHADGGNLANLVAFGVKPRGLDVEHDVIVLGFHDLSLSGRKRGRATCGTAPQPYEPARYSRTTFSNMTIPGASSSSLTGTALRCTEPSFTAAEKPAMASSSMSPRRTWAASFQSLPRTHTGNGVGVTMNTRSSPSPGSSSESVVPPSPRHRGQPSQSSSRNSSQNSSLMMSGASPSPSSSQRASSSAKAAAAARAFVASSASVGPSPRSGCDSYIESV